MGLIEEFLRLGHEVIAIAPQDDYAQLLEKAGCEFFHVPIQGKGANPLNDYQLYRTYVDVYRKSGLEMVLQYTIKPNIYGTLAAKKCGIPCINNVSGLGTVFIRDNLVSKIAKRLYKRAFVYPYKVFFQNKDDRDLFIRHDLVKANKTDLLPGSGIDVEKFCPTECEPQEDQHFRFLIVARVLYDKGLVELAKAAQILKAKGYNFKCDLYGFLDQDSKMGIPLSQVEEWGKEELIFYKGTTDDVRPIIENTNCVILPSYREGTPKSLLEGAAMQKPLIATDVPGCKEVVIDEFNGFLCKVKDETSLAEKMEKMMMLSFDELRQLGQNGRKLVVQKFDQKIVINKYITCIKSQVNGV